MKQNLIYAIKNNELIHISDVVSGIKCECFCPSCSGVLIARKGLKRSHHFSHYTDRECAYGYETALHLAAKEILLKSKRIWLPEVFAFEDEHNKKIVSKDLNIEIDNVTLEKKLDNFIPDIIIEVKGKKFIVEIAVTHPIDKKKLEKIKAYNISTLEINLSRIGREITAELLSDIVIGKSKYKTWKYNSVSSSWEKQFIEKSEKKVIIHRGLAHQVDYCPLEVRTWRGKKYANFIDDCLCCDYFLKSEYDEDVNCDYTNKEYVYCLGRTKILSVEDLKNKL